MDTPLPAMRGHYSIRNPLANALLRVMDAALRLLVRRRTPETLPAAPRILISNIAHLGDVIVATSVLPALQAAFPQSEFGFLIGSWSLPVLKDHPMVTRCHVFDHWMQSRASSSRREKWRVHQQTRVQALREIKAAGYDLAIDLYWNLPNTLPLLWQARIPVRAGYGSAGFGPLATHCLTLSESRASISARHRALLALLPINSQCLSLMKPVLPPVSAETRASAAARLREAGVSGDYVVFHPGASAEFREWPEEKWRALAQEMNAQGQAVIFTGYGVREQAMIERIMAGLSPRSISLCGRLSWQNFVSVIEQARLLVSVDTVAGHVAGAVGTPSAVLTAGRYPYLWKPIGAPSEVLMAPVPCAPCHRNFGCAGMECLRMLDVTQALNVGARLARPSGKGSGMTMTL